jgi:glycosyltransferase involved in cell wall biosynthesis
MVMKSPRIAVVQHGDYREALRLIGGGQRETYFGMGYSLEVLGGLLDDCPHLVISLDAPEYAERRGQGELVGLPCPVLPRGVPGTFAMLLLAERIRRRIRAFRPTHVLLRTSGIVALRILSLCRREGYGTLVVFANLFGERSRRDRWINSAMISMLNEPFVFLVGNHKKTATQTMLDRGLDPAKAVAYEWAGERRPSDYPMKTHRAGDPCRVAFAGSISELKGITDLFEGVVRLHDEGMSIQLIAAGRGEQLEALRGRAGALPEGLAHFVGQIDNAEVFELFLGATLVCVPSRHEFAEGMPHSLTEALASRTPVVASDHPVFVGSFRDGEGLRFFRAGDPSSLAEAIRRAVSDTAEYERLSRTTADAYARVECPTLFGDLVDRWATTLYAVK